jgi:hypothetical protein
VNFPAYLITSVMVVFTVLIIRVYFVSLVFKEPHEGVNLLVTEERYRTLFYMPLHKFLHNSLKVLVHIENKIGL